MELKRVVSNKKYVLCFSDFYRRRKCNIQIRSIYSNYAILLSSFISCRENVISDSRVDLEVLLIGLNVGILSEIYELEFPSGLNIVKKSSLIRNPMIFLIKST
jgi:hypothetical protein